MQREYTIECLKGRSLFKMLRLLAVPLLGLLLTILFAGTVSAEESGLPDVKINIGGNEMLGDDGISGTLKVMLLISAISFLPAIILTMTCFTRIAVVLGMTRQAMGTAQMPPNMIITGLALFMTIAIMNPIFVEMYEKGIQPYMEGQMGYEQAWQETTNPLKRFLIHHSREKDLALFLEITHSDVPESPEAVPFHVAVPAFVLSELNTAFQIGFLIALPFLVLDMVVSSVLTSMSMITLPPVVISLPLKLMLFVIVDGWYLIIGSLVKTYSV